MRQDETSVRPLERCQIDGRHLTISADDNELVAARQSWTDSDITGDYRQWRPMVERSIAWLVAHGHRRVRYRGVQRNQHALTTRVAALNLRRLINLGLHHHHGAWALTWWARGDKTRTSPTDPRPTRAADSHLNADCSVRSTPDPPRTYARAHPQGTPSSTGS